MEYIYPDSSNNKLVKAAIYVRVSTLLDQTVENQLHPIREYAKNRGMIIVKEFSDEGISGTKERRPQLDALLKAAARGEFKILIVAALDRLARSTVNALNLMNLLKQYGVQLISLREGFDLSTSAGELIYTVLAAVGQLERTLIAERTKISLAVKKAVGEQTGIPFKNGRPQVVSPKLEEEIMEMYKKGQSIRSITRSLSTKVSKSSVERVLSKNKAKQIACP